MEFATGGGGTVAVTTAAQSKQPVILAHSNAFFTGIGSSKRVVFFDTLLEQLSADEMEAVLAHELGHFKHKHIVKMMVINFLTTLIGFAALGWIMQQTWFYTGLGVTPNLGLGEQS